MLFFGRKPREDHSEDQERQHFGTLRNMLGNFGNTMRRLVLRERAFDNNDVIELYLGMITAAVNFNNHEHLLQLSVAADIYQTSDYNGNGKSKMEVTVRHYLKIKEGQEIPPEFLEAVGLLSRDVCYGWRPWVSTMNKYKLKEFLLQKLEEKKRWDPY